MNSEPKVLQLTEREVAEIKHALFYVMQCNHGTVGHNMLVLIAKLSTHLGFRILVNLKSDTEMGQVWVEYPDEVIVTP